MTTEPMPEPEGPEDERFVYVVTAAGREGVAAFDSEREPPLSRSRALMISLLEPVVRKSPPFCTSASTT